MKSLLGFVLAFGIASLLLAGLGPKQEEPAVASVPRQGSAIHLPEEELSGLPRDKNAQSETGATNQQEDKVVSHAENADETVSGTHAAENQEGKVTQERISSTDTPDRDKSDSPLEGILDEGKARQGLEQAEHGRKHAVRHVDRYTPEDVLMIARENAEIFSRLERRMRHH